MYYDETEWLQRYQQEQLAAQQAKINARRGGAAPVTLNPQLQAMLDYQDLQDIQAGQQFTDPTISTNVYGLRGKGTVPTYEETVAPLGAARLTSGEIEQALLADKVFNQPRVSSPFTMGPSGMQSRGRPTPTPPVTGGIVNEGSRVTGVTPSRTYGASRGGSGRITPEAQRAIDAAAQQAGWDANAASLRNMTSTRRQAERDARNAPSIAANQAIADAYAAMDAATAANSAASVVQNQRNIGDTGMRAVLAQQALLDQVAADEAAVEQGVTGIAPVSADDQMKALLAAGGDFAMGGPAGVTTTTGPAATTAAGDTAAIEAAAQAEATQAVADPTTSAVLPPDIALFQELAALESDDARAQYGFDKGIINADVLAALRAQEAAGQPMNINLGATDVDVGGVSEGQKAIFKWTEPDETGKRTIVMLSEGDDDDDVVTSTDVTETIDESEDEETILAADDPEINYLNDQTEIITKAYNDRIDAIEAAVEDGRIDINLAQGVFNAAKDKLFDDMAELSKITYDEVTDTFSFNTEQRATDVQSMLDLLAEQGVEQNLIQDVIGGDIGMNLAGYAEETDAMRDFSEMLNIIGQQGRSEAGLLGNYMFDSYRQDLETTGRNMELQAAMQQLAEQQAAAEQNLQSSILGPYFGLDPQTMMAGMGAGIDVAGVSENRAVREQAAKDAMAMLLAQQAFQTGEREAGQRFQTGERLGAQQFAGGQSYQDNVWDYLTDQTMTPYQSGMLGVAQQDQQMDTMSTLMDLINPQPTAADNAAMAAQAQTAALDSALSKMQMGSIPAQAPIFKQGQMMAGTPAFNWQNALTGEEVQALDAVGWDTEGLLYGDMQEQMNSMNEISNMGSFADVMQVPLEVLMGAEALGAGVVGALVDDIIAGGNDPLVNYTHPAMEGFEPWTESIPLSQATALYDYEYQAGEPAPFNLFGYDVGEDGLLDTDRVMDLMELGYTMEEIEEALLGL